MNTKLQGVSVYFLDENEVIKSGDLYRYLFETGEDGGFNTTYKPDGWRGTLWQSVDFEFPAAIGSTPLEWFRNTNGNEHKFVQLYEFIRRI